MKKTRPKQSQAQASATCRSVQELRDALLALHKTLIESERSVYEANVGPIQSPHHFLQLLSTDPWFAWLRPVSQLIVAIDEALDTKKTLTSNDSQALKNESIFLLDPAKGGGEFEERYRAALQRDPQVILAHAKVVKRIAVGEPQN